ncbi:Panacea domain-containing protein [Actinokineospora spheciospongiae]|uniref:Panacea domain-containing protein n=1 Tax=Actinokineospora spheciospongiae TaxID=909613 RepID=UPI000553B40D|nr:type II toxin-antitoxin system antitoxin SocA domain-containing protein [Actinokineospora spheciospongiae]
MASVDDLAAAILKKTGTVTAMKMQKLVYYCQAWHLVRTRTTMFDDRIEAWREGPVVRALYERHRKQYTVSGWPGDAQNLTESERETVDWVHDKYAQMSAESLSNMTHIEQPWKIARGLTPLGEKSSATISTSFMRDYHSRQVADVESAVAHAAANSSIEGVDLDSDWQDVLRSVATSMVDPDQAVREEIERALRS